MDSKVFKLLMGILEEPTKMEKIAEILVRHDIDSYKFVDDYLTPITEAGFTKEAQDILNTIRDIERTKD